MKMVTHLFTDSGKTWREAARANGKGALIYHALMQEMQGPMGVVVRRYIAQNAQYIQSVPETIAREMTPYIMEQSFAGLRHTNIAKNLQAKFGHISDVKANLIARTETAKTATALTQSRSEYMGIEWYRWRTSEDARVRDAHRIMDKVLVGWNDPPSPEQLDHMKDVGHYHAGCIWNCRCYTEPVVNVDFITWPAKIYMGGRITTISKAQFEQMTRKRQAV